MTTLTWFRHLEGVWLVVAAVVSADLVVLHEAADRSLLPDVRRVVGVWVHTAFIQVGLDDDDSRVHRWYLASFR